MGQEGKGGVDGIGWEEVIVESEDGKGVVGWLDTERCRLDYKVIVGSWGDWGWTECWRQLGIKSMALVAFTDEALSFGRRIWGMDLELERSRDFLNSNRRDCDIYVCHLPSERELGPSFGYLRTLGAKVWFMTISAGVLSRKTLQRQVATAAGNPDFRLRRVRCADVGGATNMEFWVCSGVVGDSTSSAGRDPRKVSYSRRASQFIEVASVLADVVF
jgi:hypothetical protein